jgi:hypothetical protein
VLLVHDRVRHQTALHYAVEGGHTDIVRILLNAASHASPAAGAPPTPRRDGGAAPARESERQQLLAAGNHAGLTVLHYAVYCEQYDIIRVLLSYGAEINSQAEYPDLDWVVVNAGDTPMHIAAARGSIESIRILLKGFVETSGLLCPNHAPPRHIRDPRGVRNDYGRLAYHLAMRKQVHFPRSLGLGVLVVVWAEHAGSKGNTCCIKLAGSCRHALETTRPAILAPPKAKPTNPGPNLPFAATPPHCLLPRRSLRGSLSCWIPQCRCGTC